jgi:2-haloacid dehalogenase
MAVMNSLETWTTAAGERELGIRWRDGVTAAMAASDGYLAYEELVNKVAANHGLPEVATARLVEGWGRMDPWPDAVALGDLALPFGFVTNCSTRLGQIAADRSGVDPRFTLTAEDVGRYKPDPLVYREGLRMLGIPASDVLFVAGSAYDAAGAHRAGLRTWLVLRRPDQRAPLSAIKVASSLREIVAAVNDRNRRSGT